MTEATASGTSATSAPSGSLWRHPDFLKLWSAETVSQFGTQVSLLAIPLVAIVLLEATPFEVGLLATIEFLPFVLFSLPAGAWVDRLRRRPILIAGDLGRAASLASIPIAYLLDALTIWQLYAVGFINGVLTVFFDVAYQSYLPSLVERDRIVEGNSKLELSRSAAQIAGPGLGGVIIGYLTAPIAVIADSVSFVASGLFIFRIRRREPAPDRYARDDGSPRDSLRTEVAEGLRYVLGHRYLRSIAASTGWSNLFSSILFAVYLVYVVRVIGLSPEQIGLVFGLGNVSTLAGALLATRLARALGVGRAIIAAMAIAGPAQVLVAVAPADTGAIGYLIAAFLLFGFASIVYNVNQVSLRQAITPAGMQGRMNATMRFIVWGTIPLGNIIGGALGTTVGLRETIWMGAIGGLFAFLPLLVGPLRHLHEMPEPAGAPASAAGVTDEALAEMPDVVPMPPLAAADPDEAAAAR
jgi:MFS family permease